MIKTLNFFGFGCLFIVIIPQMAAFTARTTPHIKHEFGNSINFLNKFKSDNIAPNFTFDITSYALKDRDVHFTNDFVDLVELDLMEQKGNSVQIDDSGNINFSEDELDCIDHFRKRPVIIRAVKEYTTYHMDEVKVKTRDDWEITFQEICNDKLLTLDTFRNLVEEHFMPTAHFMNRVQKWWNQAKLYIYRKVMARYAKTTFVVRTNIDQTKDSIHCSDIFLDLDKLVSDNKDKVQIEVEYGNLLHMHIYIRQIA